MSELKKDQVKAADILESIGPHKAFGDLNMVIRGPASILEAGPEDMAFCKFSGKEALPLIQRSRAGLLLVHESVPGLEEAGGNGCIAAVANPRLCFIRCLNGFFVKQAEWAVHPTAVVGEGVKILGRVSIGPLAIVGDHAVLGEDTVIGSRAFVMDGTLLGRGVAIQTGAVVGCDGQGFERNEAGTLEKFPQMGRVVLGDGVEIGSNSTIVRGALEGMDTVIGEGTKIGHLVDIGKNVQIGEHCLISAGVIVCGSVQIGDYAWLAPGCTVRQKVKIGRGATVGLGAVVVRDVADGITVAGVPAKPLEKEK